MKLLLSLLLVPLTLATVTVRATLVVSDTFTRSGTVLGSAPAPTSPGGITYQGGTDANSSNVQANGSQFVLNGYWNKNLTYLPFAAGAPTLAAAFGSDQVVSIQVDVDASAGSGAGSCYGFASATGQGFWSVGSLANMNMGGGDNGTNIKAQATGQPDFSAGTDADGKAVLKLTYNTSTFEVAYYVDGTLRGSNLLAADPGFKYLFFNSASWGGQGSVVYDNLIVDVSPVPEPAVLALLGGLAALGVVVRRRRRGR